MNQPLDGVVASRFTLHLAASQEDLDRLGRQLSNCIASYGRTRTGGPDRIIEVREGERPIYAVHVRLGRIVMFEASHTRPPRPADVPVVRDLLEQAGYLRRTPAVVVAAERERPRPAPARRQPRLAAPATVIEPPVSLQELATDLLRPWMPGRTEWPELAAALWATGVLPRLPAPDEVDLERVIIDLAGVLAIGGRLDTPSRPPPTSDQREAARRQLVSGPPPRTREAWQRHRMADVLAAALVD